MFYGVADDHVFSRHSRAASSSMAGDTLADLGAVNLADENQSLLSDFSLESSSSTLIPISSFSSFPWATTRRRPRKNLEAQTAGKPAWATLSAVQNDRYIVLRSNLFLVTSLKMQRIGRRRPETLAGHLYGAGGNAYADGRRHAARRGSRAIGGRVSSSRRSAACRSGGLSVSDGVVVGELRRTGDMACRRGCG